MLGSTQTLPVGRYQNFQVAVYVRAYEVRKMGDLAWLKNQWDIVERQVKVDKVYLETHRDLIVIDDATLAGAKTFFASRGIKTAGGIATVRNESNNFESFCYTQASQRAELRKIVEFTARHFDEVILDDFFFTSCTCDACIRAKGSRTWTEFRLALMAEISRDIVLATARATNPKVKVTIKFPNWYEHFQGAGYNLEVQPGLFDFIYTGTETRDPVNSGQHLQQYESYQIFHYFENIAPGRNRGGWVDTNIRGYADRYAEQLWDTMFAKAPEVTLFAMHELLMPFEDWDRAPWQGLGTSFDYAKATASIPACAAGLELKPTLARVAGQALELADQVVGKLGNPVGIASYKPFHSTGEDFLHNFFGMLGIPIDLHSKFPAEAPTILLTESAKYDREIVAKIKTQLLSGKTIFITTGLVSALQSMGLEEIAELECKGRKAVVQQFQADGDKIVESDHPIIIPELHYLTNNSWEIVSALSSGLGYPILLKHSYGKGALYVLTIPDNFGDLYAYPSAVLSRIKKLLLMDFYVRVESPSQVALYAYDNRTFIVENYRDQAVEADLVLEKSIKSLRDELSGEEILVAERTRVALKPHSFRAFSVM